MSTSLTEPDPAHVEGQAARRGDQELRNTMADVLGRWPSAGLAVGVVREGAPDWFVGHGVADVDSRTPITAGTVFRIGSVTKTFTAIAVMQLWEQGLVDLDAAASTYLRSFRLVPAAGVHDPTVRHLLTHTAGIGYWRRMSDLLRPGLGSGDRAPRAGAAPLAEYYRKGLPVEVEPGTKWAYSNHGFATLGQIVEDVTGQSFDEYLRTHILERLHMEHTDLVRSRRVLPDLATGYVLRSDGLRPVADREIPTPAAGGLYSTTEDMTRYVVALLSSSAGRAGPLLRAETLAQMWGAHFREDPREPGAGLGFELGDERGHRTVGHSGVVSGFLSAVTTAPDDGIGVIVLSNTGSLNGSGAPAELATALLRQLLGLPRRSVRDDISPRPESWSRICGWYGPDPGPVTNLFLRALMGAGAEVVVRDRQLVLKPLTPIPSMRRGFRLHPDDPDDPDVFRIDFSDVGGPPPLRVVFSDGSGDTAPAPRLLMQGIALRKRPDTLNPRRWVTAVPLAAAAALTVRRALR